MPATGLKELPPAPNRTPMFLADGSMSAPWVIWFQNLNTLINGLLAAVNALP